MEIGRRDNGDEPMKEVNLTSLFKKKVFHLKSFIEILFNECVF